MMRRREAFFGYLFAAPWILGLLIFLMYPLVASLYFSFCDYSVLKSPMFIGIGNFKDLLKDEVFFKTISNTFIYAAMAIPATLVASLLLALLLNTKVRFMALYRTLFFLPALVPAVPVAVLFLWLLNGQFGIVNEAISTVHVHGHALHGPDWLANPAWMKVSLVLMAIWGVGNTMLIFLASLQDVPVSLIEAAVLDGAGAWQKVKNVTLPMISPVILFNSVMGLIGSLQIFAQPYVMFPGGGTERSAYFYANYLYDQAFVNHNMGLASAMGWIMFLVIFVLTVLLLKFSEKRVHYGGS